MLRRNHLLAMKPDVVADRIAVDVLHVYGVGRSCYLLSTNFCPLSVKKNKLAIFGI